MNLPTSVRALLIEDVEDDAILMVNALKRAGIHVDHLRVETMAQLEAALDSNWDIVYSDYTLPGFNGMDALKCVRDHDADLPFIFVSGTIGEDRAVDAVKAGANDYIIKGNYKRLPIATQRVLEETRIKRENRMAKARIHQLINVDVMTGLASRGQFLEVLHKAIEEAKATHTKVGVIFVNIDRFRTINDTFGMNGGDQLIMNFARRLRSAVSQDDLVARLYADQFAIIVPGISDETRFEAVTNAVLGCFDEPLQVQRYEKRISGSLGLALHPDDGTLVQELLNNANLAQKIAKQAKGVSRLRYNRDARKNIDARLHMEYELESAISKEQFVLHFQAQMNAVSRQVIGAEALVRWQHPTKGLVGPNEFIPIAEESGLIIPLGDLICRMACEQIREWMQHGMPAVPIAINISSHQFQQPGFAAKLNDIMQTYDIDPACIELEITETALMSDPDLILSAMSELRETGVRIALDDFGTGYSSMSYLDRFPIDILKIDQAFISNLPGDSRKVAIVKGILSIAEKLGMKVIAEGVETREQLEFLGALGCENVQGFHAHRPADGESIFPMLHRGFVPEPGSAAAGR
ncbi:MAG: EAL domain-containing protein [Proteobacteria bacterium]|nr:EAL domain-containing protein [Pseudomonadota bacterium]